ncbi:phosphatidylserine lipase ABHD16A [Hemitrygon akajei]|uniref:phosphatidylserine lipase ABHD16A n=1 Tax=Hemitrygon akajei TaxID=2704970 RepID=UPI003BF999B8
MAAMVVGLFRCIFGPRLRRVHRGADGSEGFYYQPKILERHSDSILGWAYVLWSVSYYTSPLLLLYFYRKGYIVMSKIIPATPYASAFLLFLTGVACLRGMGRWTNPEYVQFITILAETKRNNTEENKRKLASYSFDFDHWPLDFSWSDVTSQKGGNVRKGGVPLLKPEHKYRGTVDSVIDNVLGLPCQIISYLVAKSFGRRMLYPGSVSLLQKAIMPMLLQGQARLMEEHQGKRAKLISCDGNQIDTVFLDRRAAGTENGKKLVVCCEGNAGFYEVGCVSTPLEAGYSVLGWNHPGFAGSTGVPFPQNEANAMDVVIQYAIHRLNFRIEDIILYAWSIGGFTATWATMNYPEIRALILDASFDDLVPLALKVMPESCRGLVTRTVRDYLNLNNADQLCKYQGPVVLIRRTKDEIITTIPDDVMSNRGNNLLLRLLQFRYPKVMGEEGVQVVREWLSTTNALQETAIYSRYELDDDWCTSVLQSYRSEHGDVFPWTVGDDMTSEGRRQLAIFLAHKYMRNFDATHCTPLPASEFTLPWSL